MKQKAKILDYRVTCDYYEHNYLDCFIVKFDHEKRSIYVDPTMALSELDELTADEQIEWAKDQIGKYLFFDGLEPTVYNTTGKTYII